MDDFIYHLLVYHFIYHLFTAHKIFSFVCVRTCRLFPFSLKPSGNLNSNRAIKTVAVWFSSLHCVARHRSVSGCVDESLILLGLFIGLWFHYLPITDDTRLYDKYRATLLKKGKWVLFCFF